MVRAEDVVLGAGWDWERRERRRRAWIGGEIKRNRVGTHLVSMVPTCTISWPSSLNAGSRSGTSDGHRFGE